MMFPMPPELLEQLGLEPRADTDPRWLEDHDALGWSRRGAMPPELDAPADRDQPYGEERPE